MTNNSTPMQYSAGTAPAPKPPVANTVLEPAARGAFHTLLWVGIIFAVVSLVYAIVAMNQGHSIYGESEVKAMLFMNSSTHWFTWAFTSIVGALVVLGAGSRITSSNLSRKDRSAAYQQAWKAQN